MLGILDFIAKIQDWIQYYRNIGSNTAAGLPQDKNAAWAAWVILQSPFWHRKGAERDGQIMETVITA